MNQNQQSSALVRSRTQAMSGGIPAPTGPSGVQLAESIQIANVLSKTTGGAIPRAYQGDPGGVLAMVIWADRHNIDPITAMWGVHRIPRKLPKDQGGGVEMVPFVSAALRNDLANDKGFEFKVLKHTRAECSIQVVDHRSGKPVEVGDPVVVTIDEIEDDKFGVDRATGKPKKKTFDGKSYDAKPTAWDTRPDRMLHRRAQRDADTFHVQTGLVSSFDVATGEEEELMAGDVLDVIEAGPPDPVDPVDAAVAAAGLDDPETDLEAPSAEEVELADAADVASLLATVRALPDGQQATFKAKAAQVAQANRDSWSFGDSHAWTRAELADAAAWIVANTGQGTGAANTEIVSESNGDDAPIPDPLRSARVKEALAEHRIAHRTLLDAMNEAHGTGHKRLKALDVDPELTEWALTWVAEYVKQRDAATEAEGSSGVDE